MRPGRRPSDTRHPQSLTRATNRLFIASSAFSLTASRDSCGLSTTAFFRLTVMQHTDLLWSADYPCPIQAGSVPPGLRSGTGLLSFIAGAAAIHCNRFQSHGSWLDLGLSSCPLFDYRLASRRLALVCKLPLILSNLRYFKSDESVSPGCRPPTPGSHIHRALLIAEHPFGSSVRAPLSSTFIDSIRVRFHLAIAEL